MCVRARLARQTCLTLFNSLAGEDDSQHLSSLEQRAERDGGVRRGEGGERDGRMRRGEKGKGWEDEER